MAGCGILDPSEARPEGRMTKDVKLIVEQHPDGFVAYPVGLRGVIVGQGDTRAEAIADVTSAIAFHVETFGAGELEPDEPLLDVFVADTRVAV
jgi:predicted RNase H-like HicB family nuclease